MTRWNTSLLNCVLVDGKNEPSLPQPPLSPRERGGSNSAWERFSPSSPVRSGGRPGEEGRGDEGSYFSPSYRTTGTFQMEGAWLAAQSRRSWLKRSTGTP